MTAHGHLAERLFSDLFLNAISDGVAVLRDGLVVQANAALGELLQVPTERLVGADLLAMLTACHHSGAPDLNAPMPVRALLTVDPQVPKTLSLNARFVRSTSGVEGERVALVTLRDISHVADMERRLRESEDQYRSIFENAQEGIYQTTPEGRYIRVNPALARIYGFATPEDLIGTLSATRLYVDPAQRDDFKSLMDTHGAVRDWEAQIWRRDGSTIWITENARCVRGPDGAIRYYEGTVEDVTDRKRAEEEIRLLAKVFESSAEGIVLLDDQGRVRAANPQFCAITGTAEAELRDEPLILTADGLHESNFFARALAEVRDKGKWEGEIFARRRGAEPSFPAEVSIAAVRDPEGAVTHYVVNVADIS
ncbi:MAG: PAS domain S-box protein, partial [Defluviimonas sp.]|nr:PAS domain S-box protein [Defluviimonas sp.]